MFRTANVHETTVKRAHELARLAKKRKGRGEAKNSRVQSVVIDPRVWQTAMELANGDVTRIQVISETEVLVVNQSRKRV